MGYYCTSIKLGDSQKADKTAEVERSRPSVLITSQAPKTLDPTFLIVQPIASFVRSSLPGERPHLLVRAPGISDVITMSSR